MRCDEARAYLAEFAVGALDEATRSAVQAHLEQCPNCQRQHEQLLAAGRLLDAAELLQPSRDLWPEVQAALAQRRPARAPWWQLEWLPQPRWAVASAAAAATAAAVIALAVFLPRPPELPPIQVATDEDAAFFTQWNAGAALQGGFGDARALAVLFESSPAEPEEAGES
jgi:anti-sigma factor RsiW